MPLENKLSGGFVWDANLFFGIAKEQGRVNLDAPSQKQKRHPNGCRFCGGACLTKVEPIKFDFLYLDIMPLMYQQRFFPPILFDILATAFLRNGQLLHYHLYRSIYIPFAENIT